MKKHLLIALLGVSMVASACAQEFQVENYLGINCIGHIVQTNETFYKVAQKFFVRPSTLALVNSIGDAENVSSGQKLYIPLTETNFYNSVGLESSKLGFKPVYYQVRNETKLSEIANNFLCTTKDLREWNSNRLPIITGSKIQVGWLKYEKEVEIKKTPLFVLKEKILFGNHEERAEAREDVANGLFEQKETVASFPDYSIPTKTIPTESKVKGNYSQKKNNKYQIESDQKVGDEKKNEIGTKLIVEEIDSSRDNAVKILTQKITKKEEEFLKSKKINRKDVTKQKSKPGLWHRLKGLTKNSYVREKEKIANEAVVQQDLKSQRLMAKEKQEALKEEQTKVINKIGIQEVEPAKVEKKEGPLYVENKLLRLTLMKNLKGRVSFFYSGTAGAKFYVFTNLAGKDGIIKITNLSNNKYVLAQVIGPMPEADRRKGVIVKLSDNSRRVLGARSKSFSAKVNY